MKKLFISFALLLSMLIVGVGSIFLANPRLAEAAKSCPQLSMYVKGGQVVQYCMGRSREGCAPCFSYNKQSMFNYCCSDGTWAIPDGWHTECSRSLAAECSDGGNGWCPNSPICSPTRAGCTFPNITYDKFGCIDSCGSENCQVGNEDDYEDEADDDYGDDDDDDDDDDYDDYDDIDGKSCTEEKRTGYFDKNECIFAYERYEGFGFKNCQRDGFKYVSLNKGFILDGGCSNYYKGNLCSLRLLICPVESNDYVTRLDRLIKAYKDAKAIKKAAWQNYLMIKKQSKTSYKADKKEKWEEYKSAKKEMLDEYKDIRSSANSKYLDEKQAAINAYKKSKDPAREKYKDANEAYQKAKAEYKKCREKKSSKECQDEKDDYQEKREGRNNAREEYIEIRDEDKAKYASFRDKAKEDYLKIRNEAKKNYDDSKNEIRAAYDKSKDLLLSQSKASIQNARSEYDAKKKIYLDAKAAYDEARGK